MTQITTNSPTMERQHTKEETDSFINVPNVEYFTCENDKIRKSNFEDTLCFRITKKKFHCLLLLLILIITMLEIVKVSLPSFDPDDVKNISKTFIKSFKKLSNIIKNNNNGSIHMLLTLYNQTHTPLETNNILLHSTTIVPDLDFSNLTEY